MPNKTIYVADRDLPLYDRAQDLSGGNLSAAISQALQRYVEVREAAERGMSEITVLVGQVGLRRKKRFRGVPVARWQHRGERGVAERYVAYRTAGGRYAIHVRRDWTPVPIPFDLDLDLSVPGWPGHDSARPYTLDVYDTLEELRPRVPTELADIIEHQESTPDVEDLDI